jgi:DDE superfamily endonuclease
MPVRRPGRNQRGTFAAETLLEHALMPFRNIFTAPTWLNVVILATGALLAIHRRTTTQALRAMDLVGGNFSRFHRVLSRAAWSPLPASKILLRRLVEVFVPTGVVVIGIDETIERRRGAKIGPKGVYRDPTRSSRGFFVKTTGLRWISLQLLAPVPWARRIWGLPFLTVLAPSERWAAKTGHRHKAIVDWARQALLLTARWLPDRKLVGVGDGSYGCMELFDDLREHLDLVARMNAKARFFDPPPARTPGARGRPRKVGARQTTPKERLADPATVWSHVRVPGWLGADGQERAMDIVSGTALWHTPGRASAPVPVRWVIARDPDPPSERTEPLIVACTNIAAMPEQILSWYSRRWSVEVTFRELRDHLGLETQRQWSPKAIRRTTPALFALFSLVTLMADGLRRSHRPPTPLLAAWSRKETPTFVDALAAVRRALWTQEASQPVAARRAFQTSRRGRSVGKVTRTIEDRLAELICWAA